MNCQEIKENFSAYLDDEVSPSEKILIQQHIAGCETCTNDLAFLGEMQNQIGQVLKIAASQGFPSPQAWIRLQARLTAAKQVAHPAKPRITIWLQRLINVGRNNQIFQIQGDNSMNKVRPITIALIMVLALSAAYMIPPVRAQVNAQVGDFVDLLFFEGELEDVVSWDDVFAEQAFTPLQPSYLPDGLGTLLSSGITLGKTSDTSYAEYKYGSGQQFVFLTESLPSTAGLPAGQEVAINGQPAILVTGLEGVAAFMPELFGDVQPPNAHDPITYTNGNQLVWFVDGIKIEMLSNLSVDEMIQIAESMTPVVRQIEEH